jgi:ATP-binding cassette subfamily B protein
MCNHALKQSLKRRSPVSEAGYWEEEEFAARFSAKTILRILGLVRARWRWVLGFVVTIAIVSMLEAIFTYLGKVIIDEGIVPRDTESLIRVLLLYGAGQIVFAACVFGFIVLAGVLGQHVQYDLRKRLFNHLQTLSLSYFSKTPVGWIMSRVNSDSERIADLVTWGMLDVVWALMNLVISFVFMISINWQMTLIVFAVLPFLLLIAFWFQKRILIEYRLVRKQNSKITGAYNENITGVRVVKALGREAQNLEEFSALSSGMYRSSFRAAWLSALFLPSVQLISALALGVIVWYGGAQALGGALTVGSIQAFIGYITFMLWPVQDLARVYAEMQHAVASAERTFSLIDTEPEIKDRPNAVAAETVTGEIRFEAVDFYYTEDKPVLRNFNLTVQAGETVALVGPTGGGKSTIINLICRFYEPKNGVIRINGRDYTEYTLDSIQSRIGVVLQTPHLFSGSIRENIRYGRLDASDAEVEEAAKIAGAHPFISNLEKGYDEEVGEGGNLLSVGQKQLISLARAVLAKPEIFIMDEATSSVDTLTEALIQRGMEALMRGRTSFVIAHRLSTIRRADKIIVIEDGGITEMGNHAELMRQRGHYYRLYTQQFRAEREQAYDPFGDQQVPPTVIETTAPTTTEAVA